MAETDQEIEVKFYLHDLGKLENTLKVQGAALSQERVHEVNLRFDTSNHSLERGMKVLRLRQDTRARLTYKGPGQVNAGAQQRLELEFTVSNFDTAQAFLEALGYQVSVIYEKYRTTYDLEGTHVTLDEMPYGHFAEIEGPNGETIQRIARQLGLDWEKRILGSYMALFGNVKNALHLDMRDLTFANFQGIQVSAQDLGVEYADSLKNPG
jgi:adenylate cyclase class 2